MLEESSSNLEGAKNQGAFEILSESLWVITKGQLYWKLPPLEGAASFLQRLASGISSSTLRHFEL